MVYASMYHILIRETAFLQDCGKPFYARCAEPDGQWPDPMHRVFKRVFQVYKPNDCTWTSTFTSLLEKLHDGSTTPCISFPHSTISWNWVAMAHLRRLTWDASPSVVHLIGFTWDGALAMPHLRLCNWHASPGMMHLGFHTWAGAPQMPHLTWCTWDASPKMMHLRCLTCDASPEMPHLSWLTWVASPVIVCTQKWAPFPTTQQRYRALLFLLPDWPCLP